MRDAPTLNKSCLTFQKTDLELARVNMVEGIDL
jgi:hypothetical protein